MSTGRHSGGRANRNIATKASAAARLLRAYTAQVERCDGWPSLLECPAAPEPPGIILFCVTHSTG
jgi:hypothetical protein